MRTLKYQLDKIKSLPSWPYHFSPLGKLCSSSFPSIEYDLITNFMLLAPVEVRHVFVDLQYARAVMT